MSRTSRNGTVRFPTSEGDAPWVALSQLGAEKLARLDPSTRVHRLIFAAASRLERHGHSHWKRGELRSALADVDQGTGEVRPIGAQAVKRAIDDAIAEGLLLHGSWNGCLKVSMRYFQMGIGERADCPRRPGSAGNIRHLKSQERSGQDRSRPQERSHEDRSQDKNGRTETVHAFNAAGQSNDALTLFPAEEGLEEVGEPFVKILMPTAESHNGGPDGPPPSEDLDPEPDIWADDLQAWRSKARGLRAKAGPYKSRWSRP